MPESYTYYPGCSAKGTSAAYEQSMLAVADVLGMRFDEIDDWNCCGATEYFSINSLPAYSLVARNLALAEQMESDQLVAPCSACYLNLVKTDKYMGKHPDLDGKVNQALAAGGLGYDPGSLKVRHLLDVLVNDVGNEAIAEKVVQPLTGLRIAPYYGCVIVRPGNGFDDPEYPMTLDFLLKSLYHGIFCR